MFVSVLVSCLFMLGAPRQLSDTPRRTLQYDLGAFDLRLAHFQKIRESNPIIVVGPSYAFSIGKSAEVANLGLTAAPISEVSAILEKYCRKTDRIVYAVTLRDVRTRNKPPRPATRSQIARNIELSRTIFRARFGKELKREVPVPTSEEREVFRSAAGETHASIRASVHLINHISTIRRRGTIDVERFVLLQRKYPNMIVLLSPTIPLVRQPETCRFAERINHVIDLEIALKGALREEGVQVIDFSHAFEASQFLDYYHLDPAARRVVRERLVDQYALVISKKSDRSSSPLSSL